MSKIFSVLFFALTSVVAFSQSIEWTAQFGGKKIEHGDAVAVDYDGNVYVSGTFQGTVDFDPGDQVSELTSDGFTDAYLCKLNKAGHLIWAKRVNGGHSEYINHLRVDAEGNLYISGRFLTTKLDGTPVNLFVDFETLTDTPAVITYGVDDVFVAKLNPEGKLLWAKSFGEGLNDHATSMEADEHGNVYVAGCFANVPSDATPESQWKSEATSDGFILKFDSAGNKVFEISIGSNGIDGVDDLVLDGKGHFYVSVAFQKTVQVGELETLQNITSKGELDFMILKYNVEGILHQVIQFANEEGGGSSKLAVNSNGDLYIIGNFRIAWDADAGLNVAPVYATGMVVKNDGYIMKYNAKGEFQWVNQVGGRYEDRFNDIAIDGSDVIHLTGTFMDSVDFDPGDGIFRINVTGKDFLLKLNSDGEFISVLELEKHATEGDLTLDLDGNSIVTGKKVMPTYPDEDAVVMKLAK